MTFTTPDRWVWDFWLADDGDLFHLFYLSAPKSLGDPDLRHRNATIGHAVSRDLVDWDDLGVVLRPGDADAFDATATWTGSVVRGDDGLWRMFYTGSRFTDPSDPSNFENVESIGVAVSRDLHHWEKDPAVVVRAERRWYETLADGTWREEAWRDPWVYRAEDGWHMLITARGRRGADRNDRGVIGHATSPDLRTWTVQAPLTMEGSGFAHLEVPQLVDLDGEQTLLFSCDRPHLAGHRAEAGGPGGTWAVPVRAGEHHIPVAGAMLLIPDEVYSGRVVQDRDGHAVLLAFRNEDGAGEFIGSLTDPMPLAISNGTITGIADPVR